MQPRLQSRGLVVAALREALAMRWAGAARSMALRRRPCCWWRSSTLAQGGEGELSNRASNPPLQADQYQALALEEPNLPLQADQYQALALEEPNLSLPEDLVLEEPREGWAVQLLVLHAAPREHVQLLVWAAAVQRLDVWVAAVVLELLRSQLLRSETVRAATYDALAIALCEVVSSTSWQSRRARW